MGSLNRSKLLGSLLFTWELLGLVHCWRTGCQAKGTQVHMGTRVPIFQPCGAPEHPKCLHVWPQSPTPADVVQLRTPPSACESSHILSLCKSVWQGTENLSPSNVAFIPITGYCLQSSHIAPLLPPSLKCNECNLKFYFLVLWSRWCFRTLHWYLEALF